MASLKRTTVGGFLNRLRRSSSSASSFTISNSNSTSAITTLTPSQPTLQPSTAAFTAIEFKNKDGGVTLWDTTTSSTSSDTLKNESIREENFEGIPIEGATLKTSNYLSLFCFTILTNAFARYSIYIYLFQMLFLKISFA